MLTFTDKTGRLVILNSEYIQPADADMLRRNCHPGCAADLDRQITALAEREARLLAAATARQKAIGWGDYFAWRWAGGEPAPLPARDVVDAASAVLGKVSAAATGPLMLYGRVYSRTEYRMAEKAAGSGPSELRRQVERTDRAFEAGWRYGRRYCKIEPLGEPADTHVAVMIPITPVQFGVARRLRWPDQIPEV